MQIKRVHISNFWAFKDRIFEFSPHLNVIYGPNEAGKSSLLTAIKYGLLGLPPGLKRAKTRIEIELMDKEGHVKSVINGQPQVIDLPAGLFENIFIVHASELDFKKPAQFFSLLKGKLLDMELLTDAKEHIKTLVGKRLAALNEKYLRQGELELKLQALEQQKSQIETELEVYRKIRSIEEEIRSLENQSQTYEKRLNELKTLQETWQKQQKFKRLKRLKEIKIKAEEIRKRLNELKEFTPEEAARLKETQNQLMLIKQQKEVLTKQVKEKLEEIESKKKELAQLQEQLNQSQMTLERLNLRYQAYKVETKTLNELIALKETINQLKQQEEQEKSRLHECEMALNQLLQDKDRLKKEKNQLLKAIYWQASLMSGISIAGLAFCLFYHLYFLLVFIAGLILGEIWWLGRKYQKLSQLKSQIDETEREAIKLLELITEIKNRLKNNQERVLEPKQHYQQLLQQHLVSNLEEYRQALEEKEQLAKQIEIQKNKINHLQQMITKLNNEIKQLEQKRAQLLQSIETCQQQLHQLSKDCEAILKKAGTEAISIYLAKSEERQRLKERLDIYEEELTKNEVNNLEESLIELQNALSNCQLPNDLDETHLKTEIGHLEKDLQETTTKINRLQVELKVLKARVSASENQLLNQLYLIENELKSAKEEISEWLGVYYILLELEKGSEEVLEDIVKQASELFAQVVTSGWKGIAIRNNKLYALKAGKSQPLQNLSSGTKDQLYLVLRLRLAQRLAPEGLFLILDDPFITWDRSRINRILQPLKQWSQQYQIIVATKDEWLKDRLIELNARLIELGVPSPLSK